MIQQDPQAPATKEDIGVLMEQIGKYYLQTERRFEELKLYFDASVENIRSDLEGANHDEISVLQDRSHDHELRLRKVEKRVRVV